MVTARRASVFVMYWRVIYQSKHQFDLAYNTRYLDLIRINKTKVSEPIYNGHLNTTGILNFFQDILRINLHPELDSGSR